MIYLSGLVGFLLVVAAEARVGNSSELSFCFETKQCLLFKPICKNDEYEVRHYSSVKWVSTDESSFFMEFASIKAFKRLYDYITGNNKNGQKIDMTAPVIVKMPDKAFWQMGVYTMSFLLPAEYQKTPPAPLDSKVYIQETPDMKVYTRSYSGWMTSMSDKHEAESVSDALDFFDAEYQQGYHYAVGYNSPMTVFNRHNEVWFVARGDPVCHGSSEEMN